MHTKNPSNNTTTSREEATSRSFRGSVLIPVIIVVVSISIAWLYFRKYQEYTFDVNKAVQTENKLKMASTLEHIEEYLGAVYSSLLYISNNSHVKSMNDDSRAQIQAIYDHQYEFLRLSEIYVIERDFDGTRQPFMAFERGSDEKTEEEIRSPEREQEEYRVQVEQIRQFIANPKLKALISHEVRLCLEQPGESVVRGIVYSVPIISQKQLVGIVSGMIPTQMIQAALEIGHYNNMAILANERGDIYGCPDLPNETRIWLKNEFSQKGVRGFFSDASEKFQINKWTSLWTPVRIISDQQWWLIFQFDETAYLKEAGFGKLTQGWLSIVIILFLGIVIALLIYVTLKGFEDRIEFLQKRSQAEEALKNANRRFSEVLDSAESLIYVSDMETGEVLFINKYGKDIWGDIEGKICWQTIRKGQTGPCDFCTNSRLIDADGNPAGVVAWEFQNTVNGRWYDCRDKAIQWIDGRIVRMEIATDITERKQVEERLRQSHKMEAVGTLSGGIAHNFNNILGSIIGFTELAIDVIPEDNLARKNLKQVLIASNRAADLVKQILTFSLPGKQKKKPVNISSTIEETLNLVRSTVPTTIEIKKDISCTSDIVMGDANQISQVLLDLCINAQQAMDETGGVLEVSLANVEISAEETKKYKDYIEPGTYIKLTVSDTGHGINPAVIDRIFEPFFTGREMATHSGLGLSTTHGIVKSHRGSITVESEPGKGTAFHILFPVADEEAKSEVKTEEPLPVGTERILFIDDDILLANMAKLSLESLGYEVTVKRDGLEALQIFRNQPDRFDLVITDQTMPHMTGEMLTKELLNIREDIPIILSSGHSDLITDERIKSLGTKGFLMKPYERRNIAKTIRDVLDKKQS